MSKTIRIVAISCTHAPFTPPETINWVCKNLTALGKIDFFVHLGDLFEAGAASVHATSSEYEHTLEDEFEFGHNMLQSFRDCLPSSCGCIAHLGNHDDNILAADPRRIPAKLRSLVDWRKHDRFGKEFKNWHWKPYQKSKEGVSSYGQVRLLHGFDAGGNSDELEGLQVINMFGGHPNQLVIRGHTHRPLPLTQMRRTNRIPLQYWCANVGTAGVLQPEWMMRRDTSQWATGMAVIDVVKRFNPRGGRQWDMQLLRKESI